MSLESKEVFCFNCGKKFKKRYLGFEDCPICKKGYKDLSKETQFALDMLQKSYNNND